ncbi:hypothetical protein VMCG_00741 [Cytospora schulzeri]|uniref:Uncharacterized protein n=1 Tax=Cytospora schulzeri TaxID=448051 RepID=A0A423XA09_9PEZI|nr:hypothetical protein VMCG_00741 [Valsa malicola]
MAYGGGDQPKFDDSGRPWYPQVSNISSRTEVDGGPPYYPPPRSASSYHSASAAGGYSPVAGQNHTPSPGTLMSPTADPPQEMSAEPKGHDTFYNP